MKEDKLYFLKKYGGGIIMKPDELYYFKKNDGKRYHRLDEDYLSCRGEIRCLFSFPVGWSDYPIIGGKCTKCGKEASFYHDKEIEEAK